MQVVQTVEGVIGISRCHELVLQPHWFHRVSLSNVDEGEKKPLASFSNLQDKLTSGCNLGRTLAMHYLLKYTQKVNTGGVNHTLAHAMMLPKYAPKKDSPKMVIANTCYSSCFTPIVGVVPNFAMEQG